MSDYGKGMTAGQEKEQQYIRKYLEKVAKRYDAINTDKAAFTADALRTFEKALRDGEHYK